MNGNLFFKRSITLGLIALCMNVCILITSFIYFSNHETFADFYIYLSSLEYGEGITAGDMFLEAGVTADILYIGILGLNVICLIFDAVLALFIILCRNSHKLNLINFNKRKTLHVFYIVFLGLGFAFFDTNIVTTFSPYGSLFGLLETAIFVLYIIAFINAIRGVSINSKIVNSIDGYNTQASKRYYSGYNNHEYENVNEVYETAKEDEVIDVKEEPEVNNNVDYEELYTLLAKLERQYKSGEVDEETYKRMKQTLLDNYK